MLKMNRPKLHYIIPVHNESELLVIKIQTLTQHLKAMNGGGNIYLIENGSSDNSWEVCESLVHSDQHGVKILASRVQKAGLGLALRHGGELALHLAATGEDLVIFTAADLPFGLTDLNAYFSDSFHKYGMIGVGSKMHAQSQTDRSILRSLMSFLFRITRIIFLRLTLKDSQGSIIVPVSILAKVLPSIKATDYFFSTEFLYFAKKSGAYMQELPITLERDSRKSKVRILRDSWRMIYQITALALRD